MERYLNTKELCETLKIGEATLYRLLNQGLPHLKIGNRNRFVLEDVVQWLKNKQEKK